MEPSQASSDVATTSAASGTSSWKGKRVGRFKLLGLLGQGAMGKVFRAEDTTLHRHVALKALPRQFRTKNYTINAEQLIREARSAAAIEHPNVVHIYEAGEANGVFYIAMELVEGGTIHDLVKGAGPLDAQRACQIAAEAAEALDCAHRMGIVHRDVKPSNLMLTRSGRCKVVDFGLARVEDADGTFVPLGETVGTAHFVAPEVIEGGQATPQSDMYSLAATLYLLLAGRLPYEGSSKAKVLSQHLAAPPPDLAQVRPDLPESLVKLVQRGMAKQPEDRFESAGQFAKALRVYTIAVGASGEFTPQQMSGEIVPPSGPIAPVAGRRIPYAAAAAVLGVGVLAAFIIAVVLARGGSNATTSVTPPDNGAKVAPALKPMPVQPPVVVKTPDTATPAHEATKPSPAPVETAQSQPAPPPPANPPSTPAQAAGVLDANDAAALMKIAEGNDPAHANKHVVVEGTPVSAETSATGKVFRIEFSSPDGKGGLLVAYFPKLFERMQAKFGGDNGSGMAGQKLRITGELETYQSRPEIRINSPDQVEVVK